MRRRARGGNTPWHEEEEETERADFEPDLYCTLFFISWRLAKRGKKKKIKKQEWRVAGDDRSVCTCVFCKVTLVCFVSPYG